MLYHNIHELDKETNTRKIEIFYSFVGRVDTGDKPTENISYFRQIGADVKSYAILHISKKGKINAPTKKITLSYLNKFCSGKSIITVFLYQPHLHTLIQYEYQIAPIPPDQNNLDYLARTVLLYVPQSLLPTQQENDIFPLILKEMQ